LQAEGVDKSLKLKAQNMESSDVSVGCDLRVRRGLADLFDAPIGLEGGDCDAVPTIANLPVKPGY